MSELPVNQFHTKVAGVSFRPNIPWDELSEGQDLIIVPDPLGTHTGQAHDDINAMALYFFDEFIGYIGKEIAQDLMPKLNRNEIEASCKITSLTGVGHKNQGINIEITARYLTLDYLKALNPFEDEDGLENGRENYLI